MILQLIIIQIITFIGIVFVLRTILYSETAKESKRLQKLKEENFQKQKELQQRMEAAQNVYTEKLARAEEDIKRARVKAAEEIEILKKREIDKAKEEAERLMKAALNAKEKMREEIGLEIRQKAPEVALEIFNGALSAKVRETAHTELVGEAAARIKSMDKSRFNFKVTKIEVESAYPLGKDQKTELASVFAEKFGEKVALDERERKELIAGIVVKLGGLVIDASLLNRLGQVKEALKKG